MRRREGDCQGSVPCRGPTWAGLLGWAQELMAGLPRSVSLEKEGRPLNWPPFQRSLQVVQVPGASRRRAAVGKAPRAGTSASEKV